MMNVVDSLTGGGIYGNFSAMDHGGARIYGYFFSKLTGIARRGILKELNVCDFDRTWSAWH